MLKRCPLRRGSVGSTRWRSFVCQGLVEACRGPHSAIRVGLSRLSRRHEGEAAGHSHCRAPAMSVVSRNRTEHVCRVERLEARGHHGAYSLIGIAFDSIILQCRIEYPGGYADEGFAVCRADRDPASESTRSQGTRTRVAPGHGM